MPAGGVAPPSNTPGMLGRRALPARRRAPKSSTAPADTGHWHRAEEPSALRGCYGRSVRQGSAAMILRYSASLNARSVSL